jgi:hypothetical protein
VFGSIVNAGVTTCVIAFCLLLIKPADMWKPIFSLSIIIQVFCVNTIFLSFIPKPNKEINISKVYKTIIHKVLFYIYLVLIGILYLYILKTIIIHKMPVGKFNWFGCFSLFFFIFFQLSVNKEDGIIQSYFKKHGAYFMIPVIIMQIIGLYIRISSYGLTTARYASIAFIIMATVFIIQSAVKFPIKYSFIGIAILSIIFSCTPLNLVDIPNYSQEIILKNTLIEEKMLDGDKIIDGVKPSET